MRPRSSSNQRAVKRTCVISLYTMIMILTPSCAFFKSSRSRRNCERTLAICLRRRFLLLSPSILPLLRKPEHLLTSSCLVGGRLKKSSGLSHQSCTRFRGGERETKLATHHNEDRLLRAVKDLRESVEEIVPIDVPDGRVRGTSASVQDIAQARRREGSNSSDPPSPLEPSSPSLALITHGQSLSGGASPLCSLQSSRPTRTTTSNELPPFHLLLPS